MPTNMFAFVFLWELRYYSILHWLCMFSYFTCVVSVLPDSHAGSGKCDPGQYDGQLHKHLPGGGDKRTVEGTESPESALINAYVH